MERLVEGDIVIVPFPFSDLSTTKKRPALVLATLQGDDFIACQITSKNVKDDYAIPISDENFVEGSIRQDSNIRPNKIFTLSRGLVLYKIGKLSDEKLAEVMSTLLMIFHRTKGICK